MAQKRTGEEQLRGFSVQVWKGFGQGCVSLKSLGFVVAAPRITQAQGAAGSSSARWGRQTGMFCPEGPHRGSSCSWRLWSVWYEERGWEMGWGVGDPAGIWDMGQGVLGMGHRLGYGAEVGILQGIWGSYRALGIQ